MMEQNLNIIGETFEMLKGYRDENGVVHKEFELREITGADEEAIAKKEIKSNGAKVLRTLLARCCTRIGTLEKSAMKESKWVDIIQSLSVADQDYMVLRLRAISVGEVIESKHVCPNEDCKEEIITSADIDEFEITPFDGIEEIEFELPKGFVDKDGKVLRKGKLRHPNGLDREILDGIARKNIGHANTLMLTRCIVDLEGIKVYDDLVRNLSIKDRNYLLNLIQEHKFGVNLEIDIECPSCYDTFKASLNAVNFI